jgi:hypothetical protein
MQLYKNNKIYDLLQTTTPYKKYAVQKLWIQCQWRKSILADTRPANRGGGKFLLGPNLVGAPNLREELYNYNVTLS